MREGKKEEEKEGRRRKSHRIFVSLGQLQDVALIVAAMPAVEQFAQSNGISGSGENLLKESSIRDLFKTRLIWNSTNINIVIFNLVYTSI